MAKGILYQGLNGACGMAFVLFSGPCGAQEQALQEGLSAKIASQSASELVLAPFESRQASAFTTTSLPPYQDDVRLEPVAARFTRHYLDAQIAHDYRSPRLVDFGQEATLAEAEDGRRIVLSLFNPSKPGALLNATQSQFNDDLNAGLFSEGRRQDTFSAVGLRYEWALDAPGGESGLDYGWTPRAGVAIADGGTATQAGASVRLGQYLDFDQDGERPAWYFFAGADQTTVVYDVSEGLNMRSAFSMNSQAIVGDAQAGFAMRFGEADLSVAYIHRETNYSLPNHSWDTSEGFGAFTLTWRR
ncbi:lipid A-modifier LpxR family protein [Woodsholea maritima]|uniref:lipid A-modifier LpxR family protein n=1 Tax=Woodsholea maritima TaxID=240237 RepID=UPI0014613F08|nr:lipid A-modifier LpxR family protein [Woodsholea maritima]